MLNAIKAVVREGRIIPLENVEIPEGTKVLVTVLDDEETEFWAAASESALSAVWGNDGDNIYAELLKKQCSSAM